MSPRAAVVLLIVAACITRPIAIPPPTTETLGPGVGTTHTCEASKITSLASLTRVPAPPAAQRLLAVANELDLVPPDLEQAQLVHALEALADTLEVLVPGATASILRVRASADALEKPPQRTKVRADLVRAALDAAARALYELELSTVTDRTRFHDAIDALAVANAAIDPTRPLHEEYADIRAAFHELVRAVFAATGAGEPELVSPSSTAIR